MVKHFQKTIPASRFSEFISLLSIWIIMMDHDLKTLKNSPADDGAKEETLEEASE